MTELERLLAASLKRLDAEHTASVRRLNASVSQLHGRVASLLSDYQRLVGEYESRLEADMNSIVRASSGR